MSSNLPTLRPKAPLQATVEIGSIANFLFDIDRETEITLQSDITDHYTEDVSPIQDHIALKPIKIVLKGYQGELVATKEELNKTLKQAQPPKLGFIDSAASVLNSTFSATGGMANILNFTNLVTPALTKTVTNAQAKIGQSISYIQTSQNLYNNAKNNFQTIENAYKTIKESVFSNARSDKITGAEPSVFVPTAPNARQQVAFLFFQFLWENKILVSVGTPYGQFDGMAIDLVVVRQPEESKYSSDFSITLKKFRSTDLQFVKFDPAKFELRSLAQRQPQVNLGKANGQAYTEATYTTNIQAGGGIEIKATPITPVHNFSTLPPLPSGLK